MPFLAVVPPDELSGFPAALTHIPNLNGPRHLFPIAATAMRTERDTSDKYAPQIAKSGSKHSEVAAVHHSGDACSAKFAEKPYYAMRFRIV
jgi:hypothetical protein